MHVVENFIAGSVVWLAPLILVLLRIHLGIVTSELMDEESGQRLRISELIQTPAALSFAGLGLVSIAALGAYGTPGARGPFLFVLVFIFFALFVYTLFFGYRESQTGDFDIQEIAVAMAASTTGLFLASLVVTVP